MVENDLVAVMILDSSNNMQSENIIERFEGELDLKGFFEFIFQHESGGQIYKNLDTASSLVWEVSLLTYYALREHKKKYEFWSYVEKLIKIKFNESIGSDILNIVKLFIDDIYSLKNNNGFNDIPVNNNLPVLTRRELERFCFYEQITESSELENHLNDLIAKSDFTHGSRLLVCVQAFTKDIPIKMFSKHLKLNLANQQRIARSMTRTFVCHQAIKRFFYFNQQLMELNYLYIMDFFLNINYLVDQSNNDNNN